MPKGFLMNHLIRHSQGTDKMVVHNAAQSVCLSVLIMKILSLNLPEYPNLVRYLVHNMVQLSFGGAFEVQTPGSVA